MHVDNGKSSWKVRVATAAEADKIELSRAAVPSSLSGLQPRIRIDIAAPMEAMDAKAIVNDF